MFAGVASSLDVGGGVGAAAPSSSAPPAAPVTVPGIPGCPTAGQSVSHWGLLGFQGRCNAAPQGTWWSSLPDCKEGPQVLHAGEASLPLTCTPHCQVSQDAQC